MINFEVRGIPAPQGSKRPVRLGNGRIGMVESSAKVKPWRAAVAAAAGNALALAGSVPLDGPLRVSLIFALARPTTLARSVLHPVKRPDLDKLVRSTLDGLTFNAETGGGIYLDDSQVVELFTRKEFGIPGVRIRIDEPGYLSGKEQ